MTEPASFAAWLKQRRRQMDFTQLALAERAFCSVETVKKLEAGERVPSQELAGHLAEALAVPTAERDAFVRFARGERTAQGRFAVVRLDALAAPWQKSAPAYHLPRTLTALVGRERELQTACTLLRKPGVALLTLSGPPGAGKTRLSQAIAAELQADFADGVCFVALAAIRDPLLVPAAIAEALGVRDGANLPPALAVPEHLRDKHLLLVLDNFEQVMGAALVVTELLSAAPAVKVIVTSREVLKIYGEQEFPVPALSLPDLAHLPSSDALRMYTAVELFVQRAQAVQRDFAITPANAEAVARICAWLDGLPLAIEMAAARIKWYSPQALLTQLSERLATLVGGPRDLTPRQQTLRGAIDWSYDLLDERERLAFERLSVFAGGCTAEAAAAVLMDGSDQRSAITSEVRRSVDSDQRSAIKNQESRINNQQSAVALLQSLVEKSLLVYEAREFGEPRFAMLETMREYAAAKLAARGEHAACQDRHLTYFLDLAQRARPYLTGGPTDWWPRMNAERDNLRAAMEWSLQRNVPETALYLAAALAPFWYYTNAIREGVEWFTRVLEVNADAPPELSLVRTRIVQSYGTFVRLTGDYPLAVRLLQESIAGLHHAGSIAEPDLAFALAELARVLMDMGRLGEARDAVVESAALYRAQNRVAGIAAALGHHGDLALVQGDYAAARAYFTEALAVARTAPERPPHISSLRHLGDLERCLQNYAAAESYYREALELNSTIDDPYNRARLLRSLGLTIAGNGDTERGMHLMLESLALYHHLGNRGAIRWVFGALGSLEMTCGHVERAMQLLGAMDTLAEQQHGVLLPPDLLEYQRTLVLAATLANEAQLSAWRAQGRALPYDRAIEFALTVPA